MIRLAHYAVYRDFIPGLFEHKLEIIQNCTKISQFHSQTLGLQPFPKFVKVLPKLRRVHFFFSCCVSPEQPATNLGLFYCRVPPPIRLFGHAHSLLLPSTALSNLVQPLTLLMHTSLKSRQCLVFSTSARTTSVRQTISVALLTF